MDLQRGSDTLTAFVWAFLMGLAVGLLIFRGSIKSILRTAAVLSGVNKCKMVLVVRADLKMGKGKAAAQCAHAAVGACLGLVDTNRELLQQWDSHGSPKVVVKVDSEAELMRVRSRAEAAGLLTYAVVDAGRTQVLPNTRTVVAVGPGPAPAIDLVTGDLSLY